MIDFRYHLVSIVSIFLALAVGIVLGAGPLKGELGDTLNKEVAGLRQDKTDLNEQLDEARAGAEARDAYMPRPTRSCSPGGSRTAASRSSCSPARTPRWPRDAATLRSSGAAVGLDRPRCPRTGSTPTRPAPPHATRRSRSCRAQAGVGVADSGSLAPRDVLLASLLTVPAERPVAGAGARHAPRRASDALASRRPDPDRHRGLRARRPGRRRSRGDHARATATPASRPAERWVDLAIALDTRSSGALVAAEATTAGERRSSVHRDRAQRRDRHQGRLHGRQRRRGDGPGERRARPAEQAAGDVGQYGLAPGADAPYAPIPAS